MLYTKIKTQKLFSVSGSALHVLLSWGIHMRHMPPRKAGAKKTKTSSSHLLCQLSHTRVAPHPPPPASGVIKENISMECLEKRQHTFASSSSSLFHLHLLKRKRKLNSWYITLLQARVAAVVFVVVTVAHCQYA